MNVKKTEIVSVGTELLLGQIANTNAQWLSEKCVELGLDIYHHTVVGDNLNRVQSVFKQAEKRADVIIVTGGLGPTDDDLTREAFSEMSHIPLVEHTGTLKKLHQYFHAESKEMPNNNVKMANVFKDAYVLPNSVGMAPGMICSYHDKTWIFLPGVPKEMKALTKEYVLPYLRKQQKNTIIESLTLRFIGIGESKLETDLHELIENQTNPTIATLAQKHGVDLRLTAKADNRDEAQQALKDLKANILSKVGDYFYGENDVNIIQQVVHKLKEKQWTIGAAESLTGGLFVDQMIALPGASEVCYGGVVCYDTSIKENVLHVPKEIIAEKGTVSHECAYAMVEGVQALLRTDVAISFTGVAGPGPSEGKRAGTVYIGIHLPNQNIKTYECHFSGNRQTCREKAYLKGYEILFNLLK
ncbi:MAG TPA: competence/damage-inducible protein A [Candidatus Avamphibacillus intestinigallinarum]|nr:competence/damage-inducible protein A [Candidatus Avamphibacillus intestinigallinarum]